MASINLIQAKPFTLLEPIGTTETEISVKDFVDIYGNQIVMSGTEQYCTIEPTSLDNQEIISFTDIVIVSGTVSKLTGITRGLDAQPDPVTGLYGSSPTQAKPHAGNKICILSDNPQVWDKKTSKDEDETITGNWTFDETITVPAPILGSDAATKDYADSLTYAGTPDASIDTKGASRLSASPTVTLGTCTITIASPGVITLTSHGLTLNDSVEFTTTGTLPTGIVESTKYFVISSGLTADTFQISDTFGGSAINTSVGQSGTHTLYKTTPVAYGKNDTTVMTQIKAQAQAELYGTDVGGDDTYVVALTPALTTYTVGQELKAKMSTANTGACTIDFGPGAKSVKLQNGNDPNNGDIGSGKVHSFIYDGTNLVLQNPTSYGSVKFGGTGADGALTITSGTTTVNLGSANYVELNYTSISITGTGKLAFSNPASTGTIICIKSQGDVTLTSSTAPMIDASGMGAAGGTAGTGGTTNAGSAAGGNGTTAIGIFDDVSHGGGGGARSGVYTAGTAGVVYVSNTINFYSRSLASLARKTLGLAPGSGGGGGGGGSGSTSPAGGAGGNGGGGLILQCGGAFNFTTALGISVAGVAGSAGASESGTTRNRGSGSGGGGGAGGFAIILYNSLTAASGTINSAGGAGGAGGNSTTTSTGGGGGEEGGSGGGGAGAGADGGAGGAGAIGHNVVAAAENGVAGSAGAGRRAGGGGGSGGTCAYNFAGTGTGGAGGAAGASENVLMALNTFF